MQICCQLFFAIFKQRIQQASSAIMHDANIVHAVKNRYKQKIDSRVYESRFYRFLRVAAAPFSTNKAPFAWQKGSFCMAKGQLLICNEGLIITKKEPFCYEKDSFYVY